MIVLRILVVLAVASSGLSAVTDEPVAVSEVYNWETIPSLRLAHNALHATVLSYKNSLVIVGGCEDNECTRPLSSVQQLFFDGSPSRDLASLPHPVAGPHSAAILYSNLVVFPMCSYSFHQSSDWLRSVTQIDLDTGVLTTVNNVIAVPRGNSSCIRVDQAAFVVGGYKVEDGLSQPTLDVEVLDLTDMKSSGVAFQVNQHTYWPSLASDNDAIYIFGGWRPTSEVPSSAISLYYTKNRGCYVWQLTTFPYPMHGRVLIGAVIAGAMIVTTDYDTFGIFNLQHGANAHWENIHNDVGGILAPAFAGYFLPLVHSTQLTYVLFAIGGEVFGKPMRAAKVANTSYMAPMPRFPRTVVVATPFTVGFDFDVDKIPLCHRTDCGPVYLRLSSTPDCASNVIGTQDVTLDAKDGRNNVSFTPYTVLSEAYICYSPATVTVVDQGVCDGHPRSFFVAMNHDDTINIVIPTPSPPTPNPPTPVPPTPVPPTNVPPTPVPLHTPVPHTPGPGLPGPPTPVPSTTQPGTPNPPTPSPVTPAPPTISPPTPVPPTPSPPNGKPSDSKKTVMIVLISVFGAVAVVAAAGIAIHRHRMSASAQRRQSLLDRDAGVIAATEKNKYTILSRLGKGSFSVVYLVERISDKRRFALKYVQCEGESTWREALKEMEVVQQLQGHANIITIVDMFMSLKFDYPQYQMNTETQPMLDKALPGDRYLSLVLEFHGQGDLAQYITCYPGDRIKESIVLSVAYQMLSALRFMHDRNPPLMHRDLKPENLLIGTSSTAKAAGIINEDRATSPDDDIYSATRAYLPVVVTDFGLARVMDATFCKTGVGSLPYIAPETWMRKYTTKADIWAVGCIMCAMMTLRCTANNVRVMFQEVNMPNFHMNLGKELLARGYSAAMVEFVTDMLAHDSEQRPTARQCLAKMDLKVGRKVSENVVELIR